MNAQIAIYALETGRILRCVSGAPSQLLRNVGEGEGALLAPGAVNADRVYVITGAWPLLATRPMLGLVLPPSVAPGGIVALDVPAGAVATIDGAAVGEADEDGLELEFTAPGRFIVEVEAWPAAPVRREIVVG